MHPTDSAPTPAPSQSAPPAPPPLTPDEVVLYDALRATRRELAAERSALTGAPVPLYTVLPNATLQELARLRPVDDAALLQVYGIGPAKAQAWGPRMLATLDRHCDALGLGRSEAAALYGESRRERARKATAAPAPDAAAA